MLVVVLVLALCSCGDETSLAGQESSTPADIAYRTSKDAYDKDEIIDKGVKHLASELNLSESELEKGLGDFGDIYFKVYEDDLFSACVFLVAGSYKENGKVDIAQEALDDAKNLMKTLSQEYSDYEHYPSLKGYYTTTSSFFDFCQNPTGSFEQVKTTINDYKNKIRDYKSDLDYIFED